MSDSDEERRPLTFIQPGTVARRVLHYNSSEVSFERSRRLPPTPANQWDSIDLNSTVNTSREIRPRRMLNLTNLNISRIEPEAERPGLVSSSPIPRNTHIIVPERQIVRHLNRSSRAHTSSSIAHTSGGSAHPVVVPISPAVVPASHPVPDHLNMHVQPVNQGSRLPPEPSGMKPPKYKPGYCLRTFLNKFEDYLKFNPTMNSQQAHIKLLGGIKTDVIYNRVRRLRFTPEEMANPFKLLQFVRDTILNDAAEAETNRLELKEIKQEEHESVSDFAERIQRAAELAFPGETHERINASKIDALQDGLYDRDVAKDVCEWKKQEVAFETLVAEAEKAATQNRIFKRGTEARPTVYAIRNESQSHRKQDPSLLVCCPLHQAGNWPALANTVQAGMNPLQPQQTTSLPLHPSRTGNRGQPTSFLPGTRDHDRANGLCYNCHQTGHLSRNCIMNQAQDYRQSTRDHDRANGLCYNCHQSGHLSRACTMNRNRGNQLNREAVGALNNGSRHQNSGRTN